MLLASKSGIDLKVIDKIGITDMFNDVEAALDDDQSPLISFVIVITEKSFNYKNYHADVIGTLQIKVRTLTV